MDSSVWEEVSFVQVSDNRERVLRLLVDAGRPMTPTEIAEETGVVVKTASRAVRALAEHGLVECVNPDAPRDRRYRPTGDGRDVVSRMEAVDARDVSGAAAQAFGEQRMDYAVEGVPDELRDDVSYMRLSKNRKAVMHVLVSSDAPLTPSELADDLSLQFNSVSRAVQQMVGRDLARCVTPDAEKFRRYTLTERGERVYRILSR